MCILTKPLYKIEHINNKYRVSKRFLWLFYAFEIDPKTGWPYEFNTFRQAQEYIQERPEIKKILKNTFYNNYGISVPSPPKSQIKEYGRILTETVRPIKIGEGFDKKLPEVPESLQEYLKIKAFESNETK